MSGIASSKFTLFFSTVIFAAFPLLSQQAPPQQFPPAYQQPQGAPQGAPQVAADGGGDQQLDPSAPGVARVSLLDGDVSVRRGDSGDYVAATQNAPVMTNDAIQTGNGARSEVQFDATSMLRMAQNTEVRFTDLQQGRAQMQLGRGTVTYRILRDSNAQVEIDTPSVAVRPSRMGVYRITVTDDGLTYVTPRLGQLEVVTPKGSQMVQVGQTMMARGDAADPEYQFVQALNRDEWDGWCESRDRVFQQAWSNNQQYVSPDVYGTEELAGHGQWVNTPEYGYAWQPTVGSDWSPYSVGRWGWEDYYGWTWISADPWGWAPYHYGRWFFRSGFGWAWWPGRLYGHHYWSPAFVGFFGFGGFGGGFGRIGWCPLAPFETFHPWFGRGGFHNVTVVNNVNIANSFRNARIGNGVVAVNATNFGRGAAGVARVNPAELRTASALHGGLPVRPNSQSMRFSDRQTSTVARTNFSQSRFASNMTPGSGIRSQASTGRQFSATSPSTNSFNRGTQPTVGTQRTWNRFTPGASSNPSTIQGARQFGSTPGTRTVPPAGAGAWNRYAPSTRSGSPTPSAPSGNSGYRSSPYGGDSSGRSPLRISPPLVRERGNTPSPGYSAPRYNAPTYSAPRYSAPAPHSSAPAPRSAPSGGGGARPSGGNSGGSHSSSSGGHHR